MVPCHLVSGIVGHGQAGDVAGPDRVAGGAVGIGEDRVRPMRTREVGGAVRDGWFCAADTGTATAIAGRTTDKAAAPTARGAAADAAAAATR